MSGFQYFIFVLVLMITAFVGYYIKRRRKISTHRFCPRCQQKTEIITISEELDAQKKPFNMGKVRVIAGKGKKYRQVIRCCQCGFEVSI